MDREDKVALPWMAKFIAQPNPRPGRLEANGGAHDRSYWLAVPKEQMKSDSLVIASRNGQKVEIASAEKIGKLLIRLDDRMVDLDKPVKVTYEGKSLFTGAPSRTIEVLSKTLAGRGDPKLMFDAEVVVELQGSK